MTTKTNPSGLKQPSDQAPTPSQPAALGHALDYINKTKLSAFYQELKALEGSRIFRTATTERERALLTAQLRLVEILAFGEAKTPFPPSHHP